MGGSGPACRSGLGGPAQVGSVHGGVCSLPLSLLFLFLFLTFSFSYFRPFRHIGKKLVHHQYYQKNNIHMMNILVFMFEQF